ncbi:helix-turn-helix transcriptional regulator [Micromonospora sp. NPDC049081]|uniref:helix-turn-helix domain-containing protein n=1 Tax=Micromonospora sp. NPDC049081 TaxID=3155150 RepID=UPI0033F0DE98
MTSPSNERGKAFAALIRDARTRLGWTQDQLVERSPVSRSTLLRWESGDASRPEPEQVRAVCLVLGIDPREAAVALGYITAEELHPSTELRERLPEDLEEVVEILRDPRVPSVAKEALLGYLRELRTRTGGNTSDRRAG